MQNILLILYAVLSAALALVATILELKPIFILIRIFTTYEGDKYYVMPVFLIAWLTLLLPLLLFLLLARLLRKKHEEPIAAGRTGVFVTRKKSLQGALIGVPIFINERKVGVVDNGKTRFFDAPVGPITIQAGKGKQASEAIHDKLETGMQLPFEVTLVDAGLYIGFVLKKTVSNDGATL